MGCCSPSPSACIASGRVNSALSEAFMHAVAYTPFSVVFIWGATLLARLLVQPMQATPLPGLDISRGLPWEASSPCFWQCASAIL